ncbi:MAG: S8 family peptidase [Psychromonas sp.]|nr:S8 family peptidase [Alteromonadales bacterium]MCP5078045.1 S8 family peptidase [Psychromonas sp.]
MDKAIVIGAVNQQGKKYKYSNYGNSVDGFFYGGRTAVITLQGKRGMFNGTSLAATIVTYWHIDILPNPHFPELIEPNHPRMRNHFFHPGLLA